MTHQIDKTPRRTPVALAALAGMLVLQACGGGGSSAAARAPGLSNFSNSGPIASACLRSDRRAASRALCGCVQQVAHASLSGADQSKAATFYRDPQLAQDIRQSDNPANESFWQRYKGYVADARRYCKAP